MFLLRPGAWHDGPSRAGGFAQQPATGLKVLVPGYAQWCWRQRERALVLFGSFVMAIVGPARGHLGNLDRSLVVLAFAFTTHVASVVDVIRQSAFPGFGRWMPVASASGGLAAAYAPVLAVASLLAWPVMHGGATDEGYLVNCWAYQAREPQPGEWVWMRSSPWGERHVGRVVAGPGQEVEWADQEFRVDGATLHAGTPFRSLFPPAQLAYKVPQGHVLVHPEAGLSAPSASQSGRAWCWFPAIRSRAALSGLGPRPSPIRSVKERRLLASSSSGLALGREARLATTTPINGLLILTRCFSGGYPLLRK